MKLQAPSDAEQLEKIMSFIWLVVGSSRRNVKYQNICHPVSLDRHLPAMGQKNIMFSPFSGSWIFPSHKFDIVSVEWEKSLQKFFTISNVLALQNCFIYLFFKTFIHFFESQRVSEQRRGIERHTHTESEADSKLWAVSIEPDVGLEPTNCEIMNWGQVSRLTDWATQASWPCKQFKPCCYADILASPFYLPGRIYPWTWGSDLTEFYLY